MINRKNQLFWLLLIFALSGLNAQTPLPNAHAHNDYEHDRPLLDALENGFVSVEADVWLLEEELFVSHDRPGSPAPSRTLANLYLKPLAERLSANGGSVYKGFDQKFYLMIDFKSEAENTYKALMSDLQDVEVLQKAIQNRTLVIFISGSRPMEMILKEKSPLILLDGRPEDLGKGIPAGKMPVISQNYYRFSNWNGEGTMTSEDKEKIKKLVDTAHAEGKKVRLWAHPDRPEVWQQLMDLGVDLINTDKLKDLADFIRSKN